ncbi:MAG: aspartyl/asparaginyl beta-hydroxylase domain-containing protein [Alphaproteobacteria bacterium]
MDDFWSFETLRELYSAKFIVLYVFILSAIVIHYRGKVRHRFTRQLTDHSTFLAPINLLMYGLSSVPNRPILDSSKFDDLQPIRDNWEMLRDEALKLYDVGHIKASAQHDDLAFNSFFKRGWKRFYLKWYGDYLPSARELCPKSVALLESIPSVHAAMFALLPPGGALVAHRDPFAGSLRYHLGLKTPNSDSCRIYIDGEPYSWRDGEDIVFDETYIHRALNESDQDRIILFADIERPMRGPVAKAINRFFRFFFVRATQTRNAEGDRVGVFNKIFKYVYAVRRWSKSFKRWNRGLYYAYKYVVFGALIFFVFIY